jgi:hypothetical protein
MVVTAMRAAASLGKPSTPCRDSGEYEITKPLRARSSRHERQHARICCSPAAPPCQIGPTVWMTCEAGKRRPSVSRARPEGRLRVLGIRRELGPGGPMHGTVDRQARHVVDPQTEACSISAEAIYLCFQGRACRSVRAA